MKIINDPTIQSQDPSRKINSAENRTGEFARTLSGLSNQGAGQTSATAAVTSKTPVMPTNPVARILVVGSINNPQAQADRTLNALDNYARALADPGCSLKQIEPMVQELEKEARNLEAVGRNLADGHELKGLIDQTAVLATVEAAKFRRGDYV